MLLRANGFFDAVQQSIYLMLKKLTIDSTFPSLFFYIPYPPPPFASVKESFLFSILMQILAAVAWRILDATFRMNRFLFHTFLFTIQFIVFAPKKKLQHSTPCI